jgi:hypothetical protein
VVKVQYIIHIVFVLWYRSIIAGGFNKTTAAREWVSYSTYYYGTVHSFHPFNSLRYYIHVCM